MIYQLVSSTETATLNVFLASVRVQVAKVHMSESNLWQGRGHREQDSKQTERILKTWRKLTETTTQKWAEPTCSCKSMH